MADEHGASAIAPKQSLNLELEMHKDLQEVKRSALDISKNPLLISILDAVDTLRLLQAQGKLPIDCFKHAKGFLMMKTDKIGFGLSVTQGYGLVITRVPDTPIGWSSPLPVKVDGFGAGGVMGWSEQHTIIAMATDSDVMAFSKDKRAMKIGVDFGVNLLDRLDKNKALDTQMGQKDAASGGTTQAFTVSKGMMVDVSLQGTSVEPDKDDIRSAYGKGVTPGDILTGKVVAPREALLLYKELKTIEQRSSASVAAN